MSEVYTPADCLQGRCTHDQIGQPIPAPPADNDPPTEAQPALPDMSAMSDAEIAQTAVRLLREATVEVFHRLGSADWLYELARTNPKEFLKMLQRLLPQTIEASISVQPFEVPKHIRDLTIEDLRAMRSQPAGNTIDVDYVEVPRGKAAA